MYMYMYIHVHGVHPSNFVQDLDKIVEREEDARSNPTAIRKITYKGEEEIEAEKTEAIEVHVYTCRWTLCNIV